MSISKTNSNGNGNCNCNKSSNIVALKYGDADVCSKRRKLQCVRSLDAVAEHVTEPYLQFEAIASEKGLNSSFENADYKGGLIDATTDTTTSQSTSSVTAESVDVVTSAKNNDLTITTKPSPASKGFENTFKLLESHLENSSQKTISLMQSLNSSAYSSLDVSLPCKQLELSTGLELELEAMQRMNEIACKFKKSMSPSPKSVTNKAENCDAATTLLLGLLYDFVAKGLPKSSDEPASGAEYAEQTRNITYHAAKDADGRNCLRVVRNVLSDEVLCGNRVSQMTRAYDDIEAVTRLLEEKEKDLELTVQIGKELLTQNTALENRIHELEADLKSSNDDRAQLLHELHKKNELISVLTNDADDGSDLDTPTLSKSITFDLLQKKITTLQDENKSLKHEATQLAYQTDTVEAHERKLMEDITSQMNEANHQFDSLSLELERQREDNRLQHEQIVSLTARLAEAEMRLHQLTSDNDEHITLLNITKENQNSLALELVEFKERYQEVLSLLQEAQELLRKQRKKAMPQARSSFASGMGMGLLQPESLQSELMESSLYSENSLDSGISGDSQQQRANDRIGRLMSQMPGATASSSASALGGAGMIGGAGAMGMGMVPPYKRIFETVRCASKNGSYADSGGGNSMSQLGAMSMSSSSGPRMSATAYGGMSSAHPAGSYYRNSSCYDDGNSMGLKTLSCESLASQSEDGYPAQPSGVPGAPGAKDLEAALKRLTPAEVLARRAMLSYAPAGTYTYDEPPQAALPLGVRTPDSIMSTGSSGISSSTRMSTSLNQWRLPEKLQIVKPIEGSQTLHHWSRLATPTLSGLLEERPGVTIRGGRGLDDLGMQVYTLSDVEEDVSDELPGKQFEAPGCTFTYTNSMVMHPDDGIVTDLSFLSQSQMSSRMASASTSRQASCPPTPRSGLSRKNSCSTFSVNLGLASMLNERGIKAVTPSALNTPAGPNFTPTVTPCNSPEGSPTRSMSPEPLFGLLTSGADLIRRKLVGDIERPNRNQQQRNHQQQQQQQQQQKIMLSRLERRALRSLKLVEKVESLGLENIIAQQPNAMSQLASGIASRSSSPMSQLTSLKHLHASSNSIVDDLHFDRAQIKGVLHKGLSSKTICNSNSSSSNAYNSDSSDEGVLMSNAGSFSGSECNKKTLRTATARATVSEPALAATAQESTSTTTNATASATDTRLKQMQRQKSRRQLKNGIAAQRPDLGTIGGAAGGRVRSDLGRVAPLGNKREQNAQRAADKTAGDDKREAQQSITQAFVGSVSSLLFGRKGGWL